MLVNSGRDHQAAAIGGDIAGDTGTTTSAPTATTVTDTGKAWTTNAWAGHLVVMGNNVYGVVVSNTATVLTIDRWYTPGSPGGAAAATPGTGGYVVLPGQAPAWYTALTANSGAPAGGDTALTGEITTAGGGLIRKISAYAHTGGASSYTLTTAYTANGSDALPVTVAKVGIFPSISANVRMAFETLLNATATLTTSGDQLTVTQTVTLS